MHYLSRHTERTKLSFFYQLLNYQHVQSNIRNFQKEDHLKAAHATFGYHCEHIRLHEYYSHLAIMSYAFTYSIAKTQPLPVFVKIIVLYTHPITKKFQKLTL